jgi:hypothetical protein
LENQIQKMKKQKKETVKRKEKRYVSARPRPN